MRPDERVAAALLPVAYKVSGRRHMRMLRDLVAHESLDSEQLVKMQWEALRALLHHCYEHVPYYRSRFDEIGAHPEDIHSPSDYARLPVLTRELIRDNLDRLVATDYDRAALVYNHTGGSTGAPIHFYQDRAYCEWGSAAFLRNLMWTGYRVGQRQVWFWGRPSTERLPADEHVKRLFLRRTVVEVLDLSEKTMQAWAELLGRVAPRLIYGYPSALSFLAAFVRNSQISLPSVREIVTSSETLLPDQRALITEAFGCGVFDQYGSRETYSIAAQCGAGSMHLNTDVNYVEFVDITEEAAAAGSKDLAFTPLLAYGMPLLRYVNGDYGASEAGLCDCGLPFPRMKAHVGRTLDNLILSDGTVVHSHALIRLVTGVPGVARFQFHQTAPDTVQLLIVRDDHFEEASERALGAFEETVARERGIRVKVPISYVDDIPLTPAGKHKYVISDMAPRTWGSKP